MTLDTKNDPTFAHFKRISHREDLRLYLKCSRSRIAQNTVSDTTVAVVREMTALMQQFEHVDGTTARKKQAQKLLGQYKVSIPNWPGHPFRHYTRLATLLRRAQDHGVSESTARPRLAALVTAYAEGDTLGRVLPRAVALTPDELDAMLLTDTVQAVAPARKAATNWKARAVAAEARVCELERQPAKKLRIVKTGQPVSETRSEASKRAWVTIRRNRALKAVAS